MIMFTVQFNRDVFTVQVNTDKRNISSIQNLVISRNMSSHYDKRLVELMNVKDENLKTIDLCTMT
jgi:hypothetical protein